MGNNFNVKLMNIAKLDIIFDLLPPTTATETRKNIKRSMLHRSTQRRVAGDISATKTTAMIVLLAFGRNKQTPIKKEKIIPIPKYVV